MFIAFHEDVSQTSGKFSLKLRGPMAKEDRQKHTVWFSCHVTEHQE